MTLTPSTIPVPPKGFRSGFVALIGRPNVGKSTLMNQLVGQKVAITSPVAQTTRNRLRGISSTAKTQIIFVDTPGIHKPHHQLGKILVKNAGHLHSFLLSRSLHRLDVDKQLRLHLIPQRNHQYLLRKRLNLLHRHLLLCCGSIC